MSQEPPFYWDELNKRPISAQLLLTRLLGELQQTRNSINANVQFFPIFKQHKEFFFDKLDKVAMMSKQQVDRMDNIIAAVKTYLDNFEENNPQGSDKLD